MQKKEYTVGPNKLFVEHLIPDEKTFDHPLVFVHGSFGGYWMWNMITKDLVEKGFECIAFSLRGHKPSGEVDLGKVSMMDYVEDTAAVIDELKLENPVVIGHSMAGCLVLVYATQKPVYAAISIDPSPSVEVAGVKRQEEIEKIPLVYTAMDAGMPTDPQQVMRALPDISAEMLMKMKDMLGPESGLARRDRKRGVSIPKDKLTAPVLMMGAELGDSIPFGISAESTRTMAEYYDSDFIEVKGATHPGMLVGTHAPEVAGHIADWLEELPN